MGDSIITVFCGDIRTDSWHPYHPKDGGNIHDITPRFSSISVGLI